MKNNTHTFLISLIRHLSFMALIQNDKELISECYRLKGSIDVLIHDLQGSKEEK